MFIGIDGGGTKTDFILVDDELQTLATHKTGSCYYAENGLENVKSMVCDGLLALMQKAKCKPEDINYAFLGLPAYGEDPALASTLDRIASPVLLDKQYTCDNDMVNGWAAAFSCQDGINIVSGTGSISYGIIGDKQARCGGWGNIIGDEGSGYWIGKRCLQTFSKMSDGRLAKGPLYDLVREHFGISRDLDLCPSMLIDDTANRSKVAHLSTLVYEAACNDDRAAKHIFSGAAKELCQLTVATASMLTSNKVEQIKLAFSGSVFNAGAFILEPLCDYLAISDYNFTVKQADASPVKGAAMLAKHKYLAKA